ncbi:MAG: hypothetical protein J1F32_04705 [Erysipelotrichales bacterium]|nr:hypothetical protein [Erysipelotrichales bacterium]
MDLNDYGKAFSSDTYATKLEVQEVLQIRAGIDVFWGKIMSYRDQFMSKLPLRNIERLPFNIVFTPGILNKETLLERKLVKLMIKYLKLNYNDYVRVSARNEQIIISLRHIANIYNVETDDNLFIDIINGNASSLKPNQIILQKYYECLKNIEDYSADAVNEARALKFASILSGIDDVDFLYRKEELQDTTIRLYDRLYSAAPVERIKPMMEDLYEFIGNSSYSALFRSIVTYFYICMIQPFSFYSEEIAVLLSKAILAQYDFDEIATLIDFETLIDDLKEKMTKVFKNVMESNDMTYIIHHSMIILDEKVTNILDLIKKNAANEIKEEFFNIEKSEEKLEKNVEVVEKSSQVLHNVDYEVRVALPKLPVGLDEKDADKIAEHLLELNPKLKKGEALFYAHHCTVGKYYTIQQFKAMNECAYETARTSMDNLSRLGFYQKEMIKNKFVYTPVERK